MAHDVCCDHRPGRPPPRDGAVPTRLCTHRRRLAGAVVKEQAMSDSPAFKVLIAGGGCAALEAAFRLQHVGEGRVDTTILAPDEYFATLAFAVLMPFAAGDVPHESLADLASAAGARLRRGRLASVAP